MIWIKIGPHLWIPKSSYRYGALCVLWTILLVGNPNILWWIQFSNHGSKHLFCWRSKEWLWFLSDKETVLLASSLRPLWFFLGYHTGTSYRAFLLFLWPQRFPKEFPSALHPRDCVRKLIKRNPSPASLKFSLVFLCLPLAEQSVNPIENSYSHPSSSAHDYMLYYYSTKSNTNNGTIFHLFWNLLES